MKEENKMTTDQMLQMSSEARKAAKQLQRKLQATTDPEERMDMARKMNDLFTQASELKGEVKQRHYQQESIEQEFLSIKANLEDD